MKRLITFIILGWWMESIAWIGAMLTAMAINIIPKLDAIGKWINRITRAE